MAGRDDRSALIDQEIPGFKIEDLFLSRTDKRGVIRSGNLTFQRLAGHDWDKLLGAPHKVIRHPDSPRALFHLFWERLKADRFVGAYVKNRAEDGRYYWVFAIAMPVEGGYVSVRLKPSSPMLDTIKTLYAEIRTRERDEDLSPEVSAKALCDELKKMGHASYDAAMSVALSAELNARNAALGRKPDAVVAELPALRDASEKIGKELVDVRQMFESIRGTPTNLRIQATRFGDSAVPIQIISQNYDLLTKEIEAANGKMSEIFEDLVSALEEDCFALSSVAILKEAVAAFATETGLPDGISMEHEGRLLRPMTEGFEARGDMMLQRTEVLMSHVRQLQRIVSGLAVTRVMCRIEASALTGDSGGIAEIINRLLTFQTSVMGSIERIETQCRLLNHMASRLVVLMSGSGDTTKSARKPLSEPA